MKRLTVVRHAEAGQSSSDFDRPLTQYGLAQAVSTATKLKAVINPQYVVVSPARRTTQTVGEFLKVNGLDESICVFDKKVYEATVSDLETVIKSIPDDVDDAVLIGHNPAVSSLVSSWTGLYSGFPVAFAVVVDLNTDSWSKAFDSKAAVVSKIAPEV